MTIKYVNKELIRMKRMEKGYIMWEDIDALPTVEISSEPSAIPEQRIGKKMSVQDKRVKLVVDIDKDTYKEIKRGKIYSSIHDVPLESVLAIANGASLSKNITNGEVLYILFPDMRYHFTLIDKTVMVVATIGGFKSSFDLDWWNARYKAESEGGEK